MNKATGRVAFRFQVHGFRGKFVNLFIYLASSKDFKPIGELCDASTILMRVFRID